MASLLVNVNARHALGNETARHVKVPKFDASRKLFFVFSSVFPLKFIFFVVIVVLFCFFI